MLFAAVIRCIGKEVINTRLSSGESAVETASRVNSSLFERTTSRLSSKDKVSTGGGGWVCVTIALRTQEIQQVHPLGSMIEFLRLWLRLVYYIKERCEIIIKR